MVKSSHDFLIIQMHIIPFLCICCWLTYKILIALLSKTLCLLLSAPS